MAPSVADGLTRLTTSQMIPNSGTHTQVIASSALNGATLTPSANTPNGTTPVYIVYKQMVQPAGSESARLSPIATDATVAQSVIQTGMNGATFVQASCGRPILNGATIIQTQPFPGNDPQTATVVHSPKLNGTTLPSIFQTVNHPAFINGINGTTFIQANGQQVQLVQPQALVSGPSIIQTAASPSPVITTTSNSKNREVMSVAKARPSITPTVDIRSLTKESTVKPPPPALVRVRLPEREDSMNERVTISPPSVVQISNRVSRVNGQNVIFQSPVQHGGNSFQKVYIVAENAVDPSTTMIWPAQNAADINHLKSQTVVPIGYEQQVVTPMPIYRFNTNTIQPIQILRTIPGPNPATMTTA